MMTCDVFAKKHTRPTSVKSNESRGFLGSAVREPMTDEPEDTWRN
jgi:hypothetical protein